MCLSGPSVFALQTGAVDERKQKDRHQREGEKQRKGVEMPQIRNDDAAVTINLGNFGKTSLICQAIKRRTDQEPQHTGNQIVKFPSPLPAAQVPGNNR